MGRDILIVTDRWIFVHNPKAAGKSMTQALGEKSEGVSTHTPLRLVEKKDRIAFGFIRNPWERLVSAYRFMYQGQFSPKYLPDAEAMRRAGFRAWLTRPEDGFWSFEDRQWMSGDLPPFQRRSQLWWLDGCDFIGRKEDLPDSFIEACRLAGFEAPPLPYLNTSRGGDWRDEYGDREVEFVARHFEQDIEAFGYSFE